MKKGAMIVLLVILAVLLGITIGFIAGIMITDKTTDNTENYISVQEYCTIQSFDNQADCVNAGGDWRIICVGR